MFDILFIDSDQTILQLIQDINWKNHKIRKYFYAKNLEHGKQIAMQYEPDIIVTELRFPDGFAMDMMSKILDGQPQCRFLIYASTVFGEDLTEALNLGCSGCVLKTCPWLQMNNLIDKLDVLTQQLLEERQRAEQYRQMQFQIEQYSQLSQRASINLLMMDDEANEINEVTSFLREFHFPFQAQSYLVCICDFKPNDLLVQFDGHQNIQTLLHNSAKTWMKDNANGTIFFSMTNQHSLIYHDVDTPEYLSQKEIFKLTEEFSQLFFLQKQIPIYTGASPLFSSIEDFPQAFHMAQQAARFAILHDRSVISFSELQIDQNDYFIVRPLLDYLIGILHRSQSYARALEIVILEIRRINATADFLQLIAIDFLIKLKKHFPDKIEHWFYDQNDILKIMDVDSLNQYLIQKIHLVCSSQPQLTNHHQKIIQQAKAYIQAHFNEELTLSMVAKQIPVSSSYLSSLFHTKGEIGFKEYLLFCRIEAAKELLEFTSEKISTIAKQVGFSNVKYFPACFKQKTGLTPSAYRSRYQK